MIDNEIHCKLSLLPQLVYSLHKFGAIVQNIDYQKVRMICSHSHMSCVQTFYSCDGTEIWNLVDKFKTPQFRNRWSFYVTNRVLFF